MKIGVRSTIDIKRRIVVNGREYASVEELPPDLRAAYEQAMAGTESAAHVAGSGGVKTRIVVNGREYPDVDTMPEEVRRLYEAAVKAARSSGRAQAGATSPGPEAGARVTSPSMAPIEVGGQRGSPAVRFTVLALVVLVVLGALYYLASRV